MNKLSFLVVLLIVFTAFGCDSSTPTDANVQISFPEGIIVFDYSNTPTIKVDRAKIESVSVRADMLTLWVAYGGGCQKHEFKLFGSSNFLESYPAQADVFLSHDANNDLCKAYIRDSVRFDLTPLKKTYQSFYGTRGPIRLRIHEPGKQEPFLPLVYDF